MGLGSFFKSLVKVGAPVAGAIFGGPAGFALGQGVASGLAGNDAARQSAENERLLGQFGVDTRQSGLTRRAALIGRLLERLGTRPEVYGDLVTSNLFGDLPGEGRGLTREMLTLPSFPRLKAGQNSLIAALMGAAGGFGGYLGNRDAASRDVEGRIGAGVLSPGQPTGFGSANAGRNTLSPWSLPQVGGLDVLPTRRLFAGR